MENKTAGQFCDKRIVETAKSLIALYKETFDEDWKIYFKDTVVIGVPHKAGQ